MKRLALSMMLLAAPAAAIAQQPAAAGTAADIKRAIDMYNNFNIEGARPILLNIISPSYLLQVKPEERVTAYKYLGASYAVLDKPDSAKTFFMAALDFDPFTDLSTQEFSAAEQNAFSQAKLSLFKVAIRPIVAAVLDSTYGFRLVTTHRANVKVEILNRDSTVREILYQGDNDGPREIAWRGRLRSGDRLDSTTFELRVEGQSRLPNMGGLTTTERQVFRIEYVFEPLEDTLPSIPQSELLQEQYTPSAPWRDLAKGSVLAAVGVGIPFLALSQDKKDISWVPGAAAAGGIGLGSAIIAFSYRRGHRTIPQNVAENNRRRDERARFNAAVRRRNANRINTMTLLICPATGCPR